MTDSYSIIRRFTPPTCTLEIWGKNSPLSRWTNKIVVKEARFKLSFDDPRILEAKPITLSGDRDKLEQLYDLVLSYTESFLEQSFITRLSTLASIDRDNNGQSYLQPQELVNHQINLGNLNPEENLDLISLSATQLFDLVAALEEYKTEITVLAQLEAKQKQKTLSWLPLGMSVAGILLAVGLTTVGIQVANQSDRENKVASTQESQPQTNQTNLNPPVEDVIPPEIPKTEPKSASKTPKNDPLSSKVKLPPPPAVDTPKPPPDIPDPAKYPPSGNLTLPPIVSSSKPNPTLETAKSTTAKSTPTTPSPSANSQVESTISIPPETAKPEATSKTNTQNSPAPAVTNTVTKNNDLQALESKKQAEINVNENNGKNTAIFRNNVQLETSEALSKLEIAEEDTVFKDITRDEPKSQIPQVKQIEEITSYFQQKWRSPLDLKQTLEYRLILNQNGSLKRVIPIGKASEIYLDRTNIPLMGEPFVSALANQQNLTIRLLLSPDGEVRTFLE
jgi:hypothetical protein